MEEGEVEERHHQEEVEEGVEEERHRQEEGEVEEDHHLALSALPNRPIRPSFLQISYPGDNYSQQEQIQPLLFDFE